MQRSSWILYQFEFCNTDDFLQLTPRYAGTTVYLVERRIDMLPRLLNADLCSLRPNVDRLAFSVTWEMTREGDVVDGQTKFFKSVIHSEHAFSYGEVGCVLNATSSLIWHMLHHFGQIPCCQMWIEDAVYEIQSLAPPCGGIHLLHVFSLEANFFLTGRVYDCVHDCRHKAKWMTHLAMIHWQRMYATSMLLPNVSKQNGLPWVLWIWHPQRYRLLALCMTLDCLNWQVKFNLDTETNNPLDVGVYHLKEANSLVEEFMLLANITVSNIFWYVCVLSKYWCWSAGSAILSMWVQTVSTNKVCVTVNCQLSMWYIHLLVLTKPLQVGTQIEKHFGQLALLRRHPDPLPTQFEPLIKAAASVGLSLEV